MLLESGGDARFQVRLVEGLKPPASKSVERLILDGQQRLTSLTQVLKLTNAVSTRDETKREIKRYYYFNMSRVLEDPDNLVEALIAVDENKILRKNFGRDVVLDLSTIEKEIEAFHFPCSQILNSDSWEEALNARRPEMFSRYMEFRQLILNAFRSYLVPVIILNKETSKEAVCLVFEKVNTGGVSLSVFELVTATYAADDFNLRKDWYGEAEIQGRRTRLMQKPLLSEVEPTDFLQGISLLYTWQKRQTDIASGKSGKEVTPVSAKREHILVTPLDAYRKWADRLMKGFFEAEQFLGHLGFWSPKYLPYRAQLVPLAAALTHLGDKWLEPQVQNRLARWFWCGVFGELYGGANETRIALDFQDLMRWATSGSAPEPTTVIDAGFQASRLDTLRTRTSAAYRGLYVLLQQLGAKDFFWKARMIDIDRNERGIDIHHIFPRKWCDQKRIASRIYNSIVNKTPISYKANRKIGGNAPSVYINQIQADSAVALSESGMDEILQSHFIDPGYLRRDDFEKFYASRRKRLLEIVESAMSKKAVSSTEPVPDDGEEEEQEEAM